MSTETKAWALVASCGILDVFRARHGPIVLNALSTHMDASTKTPVDFKGLGYYAAQVMDIRV